MNHTLEKISQSWLFTTQLILSILIVTRLQQTRFQQVTCKIRLHNCLCYEFELNFSYQMRIVVRASIHVLFTTEIIYTRFLLWNIFDKIEVHFILVNARTIFLPLTSPPGDQKAQRVNLLFCWNFKKVFWFHLQ